MTYASLLNSESLKSNYIAVLSPRRIISSWTLISGTKYSSAFTYGQIVSLDDDGASLVLAGDSGLSDGTWYFDVTTNTLYVDVGSNPASSVIVATYEIYIGTYDSQWYRIPTDNTSRVVYYEPIITASPVVLSSASDNLFGFIPTQSTSFTCTNAPHVLEKHIYDSSFNSADVKFYHWINELTTANLKLFGEWIVKDITYDKESTTFNILDKLHVFEKEYRQASGDSFYTVSRFSALDPMYVNRPIRSVFGMVEGFVPINCDYVLNDSLTTDNRVWMCKHYDSNLLVGNISTTVATTPACTATRTYVDDADGIRVGDSVSIGTIAQYVFVTVVDKTGVHYIEHAAITPATIGEAVTRGFVGYIDILKNDVVYHAMYGRDYSITYDATAMTAGFTFSSSLEANLSMPTNLCPLDRVFCRVYGNKEASYNAAETDNFCYGVRVLEKFLTDVVGSADLDTATIATVAASTTDLVGFAVPSLSTENFPTYKELIVSLVQTLLLKLITSDSNKWTLKQTDPMGAVDKTIDATEILDGTFSYNFSYRDLYSVINVAYLDREIGEKGSMDAAETLVSTEDTVARYLHKVDRQKTFKSLHFLASEAQKFCDRLSYYFSDRIGKIRLSTKQRFFDSELNDVITVSRDYFPGNLSSLNAQVVSLNKSLREITIELDDQKGIEDNSGVW